MPSSTVTYSTATANAALKRFSGDPGALTDADVELLRLVDPGLGDRADAKRRGVSDPSTAHDARPVTLKTLMTIWRDFITPALLTHRFRIKETVNQIAALEARIVALEARPQLAYRGVWESGRRYQRGDFVTWGGSMWHANEMTIAKPGTDDVASRAWTLAVKRGREGRDEKDAR